MLGGRGSPKVCPVSFQSYWIVESNMQTFIYLSAKLCGPKKSVKEFPVEENGVVVWFLREDDT